MLTGSNRHICRAEGGGDKNADAGGSGAEETTEACVGSTARQSNYGAKTVSTVVDSCK